MRGALLWLPALALMGCQAFEDFKVVPHGIISGDMSGPPPPDLTPATAPCKAADGISGVPLFCVDFDKATLVELMNQGWSFNGPQNNCPGWQIAGGLLQVQNFGSFGSASGDVCGFKLPQTSPAQLGQYRRLTLALQQRIDLIDTKQQAQIFLNTDTSATRLMWQGTGTKDVPAQQTTITLDSAQVPDRTGSSWLFKLSSQLPAGVKGWQFDSIAVLGHP